MATCRANVRDIFWEGACVVAAHQFLSLHGECGYVDARRPPECRLSIGRRAHPVDLARIGAAVIQRYFDACASN